MQKLEKTEKAPPTSAEIRKWLDSTGFPFEMQVVRELKRIGLNASPGQHVIDFDTGEPLDVDVQVTEKLASLPFSSGALSSFFENVDIQCDFIIECKQIVKYPWVLFRKSDEIIASRESVKMHAYDNILGGKDFSRQERKELYRISRIASRVLEAPSGKRKFRLGIPNGPMGYNIVPYMKNRGDEDDKGDKGDLAFKAFNQVTRRALSLSFDTSWRTPACRIIIPIVVIKGDLFEATVDRVGKSHIKKIDRAYIKWHATGESREVNIQVLTLSGLKNYFKNVNDEIIELKQFLTPYSYALAHDGSENFMADFWEEAMDPASDLSTSIVHAMSRDDVAKLSNGL